ncbi:hypothetical protein CRUP_027261, partial [Coryphaenoides rupestris]
DRDPSPASPLHYPPVRQPVRRLPTCLPACLAACPPACSARCLSARLPGYLPAPGGELWLSGPARVTRPRAAHVFITEKIRSPVYYG